MAPFRLPASGAATRVGPQLFMRHFEQSSQVGKREKMLTFSTVEVFISFTSVKRVKMKIKDLTHDLLLPF